MDVASTLSSVSGIATTIATVVLALLTGWYVRLTHAMLKEQESERQPNVYVDIEFSDYDAKFTVGNSGKTPAIDIKIAVKDNIPWPKREKYSRSLSDISPTKNGVSYLAPSRILKYSLDLPIRNMSTFDSGIYAEFKLGYKSEDGQNFKRDFVINLDQYSGILLESFRSPEIEVARAIKRAEESRREENRSGKFVSYLTGSMGKRARPLCGESISAKAKKCPRCHEYLPNDSSLEKPEDGAKS